MRVDAVKPDEGLGKLSDEERAQKERIDNAGARRADDCFCPSCGARGFVFECNRCSRPDR